MKKTKRNIIIIVAAIVAAICIVLAIVLPITLRHRGELFTVTFESNGGSAVESIVDVPYGSTIAEPTAPVLDNYIFAGWYSDARCIGRAWNFDTDRVKNNITLYAKWNYNETSGLQMVLNTEANTYTVVGIGNAVGIEELAIPEKYKGLPVTVIADGAFDGNKSIKSVFIPESIEVVRKSAFANCENLTSITFAGESTTLGEKVFFNCKKLQDVKLPYGLTIISKELFNDCSMLAEIELPSSLIELGDAAFGGCISLKSIVLPSSLRVMGEKVFANCSGLESLRMESRNTTFYSSVNGVESNCIIETSSQDGKTANTVVAGCKTSQIPSNVTAIGLGAFCGSNIESITIPHGITEICNEAFSGCTRLKRITIPNSVTFIGDYAFYSCEELSEVTFAKKNADEPSDYQNYNIQHIGLEAFAFCYRLASFYLPDSLEYIGAGIFSNYDSWWIDNSMTIKTGHTAGNLNAIIHIEDYQADFYTHMFYVDCFNGSQMISGLA